MPDTKLMVLFNSGEGVTHGDMNNIQNALNVLHGDYGFGGLCRDTNFVTQPSLQTVYAAPGGLQGCIRAHPSTVNMVTNYGGTIYLRDAPGGAIDGVTPHFITYKLSDGELDTTLTPDPALPRWAGIFIRLDLVHGPTESRDFQDATTLVITSSVLPKSVQAQLTKQVVHGVPSASPAIPSTPVGYAPLAYVFITAAHATTFTNSTDLVDCRFPLGMKAAWIPASALIQATGTMSYSNTTGLLTTSGTGVREIAALPHLPYNARLISARFFMNASGTTNGTPQIYPVRRNSGGSITNGSVSIGSAVFGTVEGAFNLVVGNSAFQGPFWADGFRHPMTSNTVGDWVSGGGAMYVADITSGSCQLFGCLIIYAGG